MQLIGVLPGVFDWIDLAIYALIMIPTISKEFKPVNKMEKNITGSVAIAVFTFAILASNGGPKPEYMTGTFTLADRENDIFTKSALIKSLKLSSSPSIVLRVPDPGDKVTEEQIVEAAKQAYAWEFIAQMPDQLDTEVGERGVLLSGGLDSMVTARSRSRSR